MSVSAVPLLHSVLVLATFCSIGLACASAERSPEAFCETLAALGSGHIDVDTGNRNELVGHVASLEALMEVAPRDVEADLEQVRDVLADLRDAGGLSTLLVFADLQDPQLAAAEGRVTEFVAAACGVQYGEISYAVDDSGWDATRCPGWPRAGSPLTNNRFPYWIDTSGANYFSVQFWSVALLPAPPGMIRVPRGGRVEFQGEYPYARYFAYHPNDVETNNLDTLVDHALDPDPGSVNPWRGPSSGDAARRYTANLVFGPAPADPAPNTSYVGERKNGGFNPVVFLLLRVYAADRGALPPNSAGVLLPAITVYDEDGEALDHFEACEPYPEGAPFSEDHTRFPAFPVPDHRAVSRPGEFDSESNFGLPIDLLSNRDVAYASAFYSRSHGEVFAVRARALRTPNRRTGVPLFTPDVDIRLWQVCVYNFWNGRALDCRIDEDIAVDATGDYTLVMSGEENRPENARPAHGATWLDTGPFLDGWLSYRMLLAENPLLRQVHAAIEGESVSEEAAPYVPRSAFCSRRTYESGGFDACRAAWESARR